MTAPVLLINPNSSADTTRLMVEIARDAAATIAIDGMTAPYGPPLITNEAELAIAAEAVAGIDVDGRYRGVIVAAFGDPGRDTLGRRLNIPVVGIAEAGMRLAAKDRRRFSVATTTPNLVQAIERRAAALGCREELASIRLTDGALKAVMGDPDLMLSALARVVRQAIEEDGAEVVVIGGGPLAAAARILAASSPVPLIEPLPAAVAEMERLLRGWGR